MRINHHAVPEVLRYGSSSAQIVECWDPSSQTGDCPGVAVLVHGGYWRSRFDASLMTPLLEALTRRGWATANVEYRSTGNGGGWPTTLNDVHAALDALTASDWRKRWNGPTVGMGHSVGGQLLLLSAHQLDALVALAPVTDVVRTYHEGLGDDAAANFFGNGPDHIPDVYKAASPVQQLPLGVPALVVHGSSDGRVPLAHSLNYVEQAHRKGDPIDLFVYHHLDHLTNIDPSGDHWSAVVEWMSTTALRVRDLDGANPEPSIR
jgi:acetyl esterase/lipase